MFKAILACLLDEDWTTPRIDQLQLMRDGGLLARLDGHAGFDPFLGAQEDLIRNVHGRESRRARRE